MLLHFTRETFFVITGFVLFHSNYAARPRARAVLAAALPADRRPVRGVERRLLAHAMRGATGRSTCASSRVQLLTGTAEYHLYFLLVSMQVYLVFGLLVRVVRRTAGHHAALLAGVAVLQVAIFWLLHDALPSWHSQPHWVAVLAGYAQQLLPLLPGVRGRGRAGRRAPGADAVLGAGPRSAARPRRRGVRRRHRGRLPGAGGDRDAGVPGRGRAPAGDGAVDALVGDRRLARAGPPLRAATAGPAAAARRSARVRWISFGVFLVHPLVISLLLTLPVGRVLPGSWAAADVGADLVATVLVSVAAVEVFVRTPLSLPLTGRRRRSAAPA